MKHAGELSVFTLSYLYLFCSMLTFRAVIGLRFVRGKIIILPNPRPTPAPSSAPSLLFPHVLPPPSPAPPTPTHPRSTVGPLPTIPQRREPPGLRRLSPLWSLLPDAPSDGRKKAPRLRGFLWWRRVLLLFRSGIRFFTPNRITRVAQEQYILTRQFCRVPFSYFIGKCVIEEIWEKENPLKSGHGN